MPRRSPHPRRRHRGDPVTSKTPSAPAFPMPAAFAGQATGLMAGLGQSMRSLAGLPLPPDALLKLQQEYLAESTQMWNRLIGPSKEPPGAKADKRFTGQAWLENPATAYLAQMYLL